MNKLRKSPTDRDWWTLTKSLSGIASRERFSVPSPSSLATYFSTKLSTRATDTTPEPHLEHPSEVLLCQFRVKKSRVCHILTHLDPAKSVGDDNISPRVLKYCARSLCGPLTTLFQRICRSSIFPSSWKISRITTIYKRGSGTDPANYRPVAVLPTLSGVFERVLLSWLEKHITSFIPSQQFGFMSGSSCADAGISMTGSVVAALNQRAEVRLVALDIKGAFDSVWWQGFLCYLRHIGVGGLAYQLFTSYLSERAMYVATADGQSSMLTVSAGVPQGAVWSPLLFNLYIRFLPSVVQFSVIGYADDHTLLKIIPLKQDHLRAADELNTHLTAWFQFGQQWFMDFAPLKTKTLLISRKRDTFDHSSFIPE